MKTFLANRSPVRGELGADSRELGRIRAEFAERSRSSPNVRRSLREKKLANAGGVGANSPAIDVKTVLIKNILR